MVRLIQRNCYLLPYVGYKFKKNCNNQFRTVNLTEITETAPIDQVNIEERVQRLNSRSIKRESKIKALKMALSMVDLTTLAGMDTPGKVAQLCQKAKQPHVDLPDLPTVAAVCVYPNMVEDRKSTRLNSSHVSISYAV